MSLTERQRSELNRVCGELQGLSEGLEFADMFNASNLQKALIGCKARIEKVLDDPGEPVVTLCTEELLKGVK